MSAPRLYFPYSAIALGGHVYSSFLLIEDLLAQGYDARLAIHGEGPVLDEAVRRRLPVDRYAAIPGSPSDPKLDSFQASAALKGLLFTAPLKRARIAILHVNDKRMLRLWAPAAALAGAKMVAHWRSTYTRSISIDAALASAKAIIAVSQYSRDGLPPFARRKCEVIYNPFEAQLSRDDIEGARRDMRTSLGIPHDAAVLGFFGSRTVRKRPSAFIDILNAVARSRAQPVWGLMCGGDGVPHDPDFASKARGAPTLVVRGHVADVERHMAACDVIVHPATREPLARVGVEAQSLGLPILASQDGGLREVIRHGVDGFILPPDDIDAWRQAIVGLLDDDRLRAEVSTAAFESAARLSRARHVSAVIGVYQRLGLAS
ncbi:MAG: glycosyltransferase family 4 protein [Hyphomonadaceae bacterium]|nr:glycosyltransferase family 4 protein [Hyphomonadaceae bacterium]